jgi:hypothetical protein
MADIPEAILQRLRRQAGPRCGYCRTSAVIIGQPLTIEHLRPVALGGRATVDALKLNNPEIVAARVLWVGAGWHPPAE